MLNKQKGNMYDWVTHTWNPIKGECPHRCHYCYMQRWGKQKPVRLVGAEFKTKLGVGNTIFVGSSTDMWASEINSCWIGMVLDHCNEFGDNTYLFQSKNPYRFTNWTKSFPKNIILGTTIESNFWHREMGISPEPFDRYEFIKSIKSMGFKTMITIEPVMKFGPKLIDWIKDAEPDWVNIGANTNRKVNLNEPTRESLQELVSELQGVTEVKIKSNLSRIVGLTVIPKTKEEQCNPI